MKNRATFAALWALLACGSTLADFSWDGDGGDDLMSNVGNWDGDNAPPLDVAGETLLFGALGVGSLTPDVAADDFVNIGGISFNGALGSYTIQDAMTLGGSFSFIDDGLIENDSGFLQTIDVDLVATGLLQVAGDSTTTLGGIISGAGGSLLKTGIGSLLLSGDNTFDGGVELREGTLVLGDNDALGTGTLSVTGDSVLQSDDDARNVNEAISIGDMVTLTVSGDTDLRLTGTISGAGSLTVDMGDDTRLLSLNGANTYSGGTTLNSGGVILGSNISFGTGDVSVTGDFTLESNLDARRFLNNFDVATGATLSFTGESILQQFGVVISGDGALAIDLNADDDEMVLRGVNTYTGGTTLTTGTIVLANNAALGDGALILAGNGTIESTASSRVIDNDIDTGNFTLTFDGTRNLQLNGIISGTGGLTLDAAATLTLTGDNTMTGLTQINMGSHLAFDGGTLGGSVDINDGGLLTGDGRILGVASDLTLRTGGTLSPGDSVGTIEVGGDYLQETGSTYIFEIDADSGLADLLDVTGAATLESGSTIEASLTGDGYIASGQLFAVIEADGGITDNGVQLVTDLATVTVDLIRDPGFVNGTMTWSIELSRAANAYSAAALSGNNMSIGSTLDSTISIANADPTGSAAALLGRLDALDATTYNQAVSALSPEPFNVTNATNLENIRNFTTQQVTYLAAHRAGLDAAPIPAPGPLPGSMALAANDPLILAAAIAQAEGATQPGEIDDDPRWGRYFKVSGVFADQDTTTNRTGFDATAFGAQVGIDYSFTTNFVAGLALGYMYTDADLKLGRGNIQDQVIRAGPYASYYKGDWYLDGSATFAWHFYDSDRNNPTLGLSAHGNYEGYDITGYLGTGYRFHVDRNLTVTPIASVLYSHFYYESFTESGSGGMPLTLPSRDSDSFRSRLGASVSYRVPGLKFRPIPYLYMGWEHEYLDDDSIDAAFASGGSPFTIDVGTRDTDAFFLGGGINILVNRNVSAFFRIEGLTGTNSSSVGAAAGVSIAF